MALLNTFQRIEKKYRLTLAEKARLLEEIEGRLLPDPHGRSTICSIYLDTPDHRLIRDSIDAKTYKEKIRLRSYGTPTPSDPVFLELKKKYKGVVYKRRVVLPLRDAERYLAGGKSPIRSQIMSEIDYAMRFYDHPKPSMMICCEREAFYCEEDPGLRFTFDAAIRYRDCALRLGNGSAGHLLLPEDAVIMEIKTARSVPLWLAHALDRCAIYPSSFSKYGAAYRSSRMGSPSFFNEGVTEHAGNF